MPIAANISNADGTPAVKTIQMDTSSTDISRAIGTSGLAKYNVPSEGVALEGQAETETTSTEGVEQAPEETMVPVKEGMPDQDARSLFIKAQKAERRAAAQLKKAQEMAAKAEKFEKAMADANPASKYQALGLDPQQEYQKLTEYALKQMEGQKEVDPIQERFKKQEEELKAVAQQLQKQQDDLKLREQNAQEAHALHTMVLPVIQKDLDRYESLLQHVGGDPIQAAIYVYNTAKKLYFEEGASPSFEELANGLEKWHTDLLETGLIATSKMKKFKDRLALSNNSNDQQADLIDDITIRSKTPPTQNAPKKVLNPSGHASAKSREERNAMFLKNFDKQK